MLNPLQQVSILCKKLHMNLKVILDEMEFDPARLEVVEERLALHISLKRKYGKTIEDILLYRDKIADELENLVSRDERLSVEQEKLEQLYQDLKLKQKNYRLFVKQPLAN